MPITEDVSASLKEAMRARDTGRVTALRNIRAAFLTAMKSGEVRDTLPDDEALAILTTLAKQRRESIEAYEKGGRTDLVASETAELAVLESYLPKMADEATTRQWIAEAIAASGAQAMSDMGKVMGKLMAAHKGEIDGKLANRLVRELLS